MARSRSLSHNDIVADSEEEERSQSKGKKDALVSDDDEMAEVDSKDSKKSVKDKKKDDVKKQDKKKDNDEDDEDDEDAEKSGDETESEYEIEAILDAELGMFTENEYAYFVSWKGYGAADNSWVAQDDAGNAMELIQEYWKSRPKKETPKPGVGKKRGSVSSKRDSSVSVKRESIGTRGRKSATRQVSEDSDIEVIEEVQPKSTGVKRRKTGSRKEADALAEPDSDDDEMLKPAKKLKTNGKLSTGTKAIKLENDEAESDTHGATAVEDEEQYATLPDMEPYMHQPDWEQLVKAVDTIEQHPDGTLRVYLTLDNNTKASHDSSVVRQRCPQKLITFFEGHLRWKQPRA